jgi:hypothetical protein
MYPRAVNVARRKSVIKSSGMETEMLFETPEFCSNWGSWSSRKILYLLKRNIIHWFRSIWLWHIVDPYVGTRVAFIFSVLITFILAYKSTRCQNSEDWDLYQPLYENRNCNKNGIVKVKFLIFFEARFFVFLATIVQTKRYVINRNTNFYSCIKTITV